MQWRPVVFFTIQALACIYAMRRGGLPERLVAVAMAVAAIATAFPAHDPLISYRTVQWRGFAADAGLLLVLIALACAANRFWPMWMAAVHLDALAVHAIRAIDPDMLPSVYAAGTGWAAYPMIGMLIVGTARHRHRMQIHKDPDWSYLRW